MVVGSDFHDAWSVLLPATSQSPLTHFIEATGKTPGWFSLLMAMRNRAVRLVGLKDLGAFDKIDRKRPSDHYRIGDQVGIFTLIDQTVDELLLGVKDKHLDVMLSVFKETTSGASVERMVVSTVVHVHNTLGRLYMLPVVPVHRIATRAFLGRMSSR